MNKDEIIAKGIKEQALLAIQDLARIFDLPDITTYPDYENIRHAIGIAIGEIDASILMSIYQKFPDLDDLK